ncbi:hypothetical protein LP419_40515 [Massilia sp. H-1]|nr:hypothetical protein LP419_40515 [Massilia sp. H-1]
MLRWTDDAKKTWSAPRQVLRVPEPVEANGEGRPKLAFGPAGQLYLSYTSPLGKPHTGNIRFVRSLDGGTSFSDPVTLQSDRALTGHRFDSLIVDRAGRVFVAWIDKRDLDAARGGPSLTVARPSTSRSRPTMARPFCPTRVADHACRMLPHCALARCGRTGGGHVAPRVRTEHPRPCAGRAASLRPRGRTGACKYRPVEDRRLPAPRAGARLRRQGTAPPALVQRGRKRAAACCTARPTRRASKDGRSKWAVRKRPTAKSLPAASACSSSGRNMTAAPRASWRGCRATLGQSWRHAALAATGGASDHPHLVQDRGATWLVWNTELDGIVVRPLENV